MGTRRKLSGHIYIKKMEKININVVHDFDVFFPYIDQDRKNVESNCNEITFINQTDGSVQVNNFTIATGAQLVLGGNSFELIKTKFQIANISATTGSFSVLRKRYL